MKKLFPLLLAAALLLTACGPSSPPPAEDLPETESPGQTQPAADDFPLELDILRIEISRGGLSSDRLMEAARTLPGLLKDALASNSILAGAVQVTIGSSPAATVQALNEGSVDLAILPAEGFAGQETGAAVLLASGPGGEDVPLWADNKTGFQTTLWTAPTDYGRNLASRAGKEGALPTWDELDHARWGLLDGDSLPGRRAVDLWLADHYEGNTTANLSRVTVYGDFGQLFQAAEAGELDVFPGEDQALASWDGEGAERLREDLFSLGQTEWFYDAVLAVSPMQETLSDPALNLRDPLMFVLTKLCWYDGTQTQADGTPLYDGQACDEADRSLCRDVFGPYRYSWAEDKDLDPTRRLLTLEGRTAE